MTRPPRSTTTRPPSLAQRLERLDNSPAAQQAARRIVPLAVAGLLVASVTVIAKASNEPQNLVRNPTFDSTLASWGTNGPDQRLSRVGGAHGGAHAVSLRTTRTDTAVLNDSPNTVASTVGGTTYTAAAWVRGEHPIVNGALRLREVKGSALVKQGVTAFSLRDTAWHRVVLSYTTAAAGSTMDLNVLAWSLRSNQALDVDDVSLYSAGSPAVRPLPLPTVLPTVSLPPITPPAHPHPSSSAPTTQGPPSSQPPSSTTAPVSSSTQPAPPSSSVPVSSSAAPSSPPPPPPAARPSGTAFGSDVYVRPGETFSSALAREDSTYGTLRAVRAYFPGLPNGWPLAGQSNRTIVVSFKALPQDVLAGKDDDVLRQWFASSPRNQALYWSYWHEPENDIEQGTFTAADYRAAWVHIAALAYQANNPNLTATLILMAYTLNPHSGRSFTEYYPGSSVIGELGWDAYNTRARYGTYEVPADIYGNVVSLSKSLGKPWGIAETGSLMVSGDDGTNRAQWVRSAGQYLATQGASWATYFDANVGGDFELNDVPSQQAWRSQVSGN